MRVIFLAYGNNREQPLPHLKEEEEKTFSLLSRRQQQNHFHVHRDAFATIDSIIEFLELYRKELIFFSFSGHAGRDNLLLSDRQANAKGIAGLLSQCPRLKVVLLNGCSTSGQVEQLLSFPSRPVVIATQAAIGDRSATKFAISFFRELAERNGTVEQAFETGLNAARLVSKQAITEERSLYRKKAAQSLGKAQMGIYASESKHLLWRLPTETDSLRQRKETLTWLKYWAIFQVLGLFFLFTTVLLQVPTSSPLMNLVPLIFFFAPFWPTMRTQLPRRRLWTLLIFHATIYYLLLFIWMKDDLVRFFIYLLLGLGIYFIILSIVSGRK